MRRLFFSLLLSLPLLAAVQEAAAGSRAEVPQVKTENADQEYLSPDAVPVVDGRVEWTYDLNVHGKSADQIYQEMQAILTKMTKGPEQLEKSRLVVEDPQQHRLVATMQEWLIFTNSLLSLDRTKFSYVLSVDCTDGHLHVVLSRIYYAYPGQKDTQYYKAEEWITDEYAVNKKHTRLLPVSGKFRRRTIDRKNELFKNIKAEIL